ncbi:hypothetical protein [Chryseobacterium sp. IT-36CA2]|uniref:hypothetical protein n=1 Tax=Chryseobacterium sp. IT-36CA2 TaxID=3026460 RepID=UPI0039E14AB5
MIETEITITINRKSDIEQVEQKIINSKIQSPVFIRKYAHSYQIDFTSDYEQWELDTAILGAFPDYEYVTNLGGGRKEIRVQVSRYQSPYSTDGWGRQIETPLNETKYLVKKSDKRFEEFSSTIRVLFGDEEQHYYVNTVPGLNKANDEQGVLLLNNFKTKNKDSEIFGDKLYRSEWDAFHSAYYKMQNVINADFVLYLEKKKKETTAIQKVPRKIIRDFIAACNSFDEDAIIKNLHETMSFEKLKNFRSTVRTDGIIAFKEYLTSADQQLCGKNFKIRTSWNFALPVVTIGVKYFPSASEQGAVQQQKYDRIQFRLQDDRINRIIIEG